MAPKSRRVLFLASLFHILNDGYRVAIVGLVPLAAEMLGLSYAQVGLLGTALKGSQTAIALPASLAASRMGDVLVLQLGLLLYVLPVSLFGWAREYSTLALLLCAAGIGFGAFHPVGSALVAKIAPRGRLGRSLGLFISAGDIGKVGFPLLTTLLLSRTSLPFTGSALGLTGLVAIVSSIRATRQTGMGFRPASEGHRVNAGLSLAWRRIGGRLSLALMLGSLDSFTQEPMMFFLPFLMMARGVPTRSAGLALSAYFAGSFIGKSSLGRVSDRRGSAWTMMVAKAGAAAVTVLLASTLPSTAVLLGIVLVLGCLCEGTAPVTKAMLGEAVFGESLCAESYNLAYGAGGTFNALLGTLSVALFGVVADRVRIEAAFYANAVFILLMVVLALAYRRTAVRCARG